MKKWTEGLVHVAMRKALRNAGFKLIAGEFPGGSDHELYPLNVTDPTVARDRSPDPRRHSTGELIPDIVALKQRCLVLGEAKVNYNDSDRIKLAYLINERRGDLQIALAKFSAERRFSELMPFDTLTLLPVLIFTTLKTSPALPKGFSYMRMASDSEALYEGTLAEIAKEDGK
jgi:hypothetical protein